MAWRPREKKRIVIFSSNLQNSIENGKDAIFLFQGRRNRGSRGASSLADILTIFQLQGQIIPTTFILPLPPPPSPYFQTFLHLCFQNWNRHKRGFINGSNFYLTWQIIFLYSLLWLLHHMFHESWIDESWIYFTKLTVCFDLFKIDICFRINGK